MRERTLDLSKYNIQELAALVVLDWKNIDPYAGAYLEAMLRLKNLHDCYGSDTCDDIVTRFLINATSWRGEMARNVKLELKSRLKEFQKESKKK